MRLPSSLSRARRLLSGLLLVAGIVVALAGSAAPASAAVAFRSASCGNFTEAFWPPYSITFTKPTGTAAGDVMLATVRTSGWYSNSAAPSGWTELSSDTESSTTWYHVATASEPTSYTFNGPSGGGNLAGGIASFSGADTDDPFADTQQTTTGTAAAITLPNATAAQPGSMRYSAILSSAGVTTTFGAGLTEACDQKSGSISAAMAYEAVGAGTTATRVATRSGTGANVAQTFILNPASSCSAGSLALTPFSNIAFPTVALNGLDQTVGASAVLRVNDLTSTHTGWNLTATSTLFTNGIYTLPASATKITGVGPAAVAGQCNTPTSSITPYPIGLPAAAAAPTAVKIFNAAANTGRGPVDLTIGAGLTVPARAHTGTYTSVWTFTLAAGP